MSELQIAWLELATVGGVGVILALAGIIFHHVADRQSKLCTKQTEGVVVQYGFPGKGKMYPIVEYFVDGTCYRTKKKFCGVKIKKTSGMPIQEQSKACEDEKGWLHITIGPSANLRQLAEQLWPVGSKRIVYYNPSHPQKCYVDRPVSESFVSVMFLLMGLLVIILSVLIFFLI